LKIERTNEINNSHELTKEKNEATIYRANVTMKYIENYITEGRHKERTNERNNVRHKGRKTYIKKELHT